MKLFNEYRKCFIVVCFSFLFGGLIVATVCNLQNGNKDMADFLMKTATALGTLAAVICALFPDYLRASCDPVRVTIEVPLENNNVFDKATLNESIHSVYCHHLCVRNKTPHRVLLNCRVWLKKIEIQQVGGAWTTVTKSPVPRLMEWAPSEFSKDMRTFTEWQIFDLGKTFELNKGFEFTINSAQGGAFPKHYDAGKKLKAVFFITADNYVGDDEFAFEIDTPLSDRPAGDVEPARVLKV